MTTDYWTREFIRRAAAVTGEPYTEEELDRDTGSATYVVLAGLVRDIQEDAVRLVLERLAPDHQETYVARVADAVLGPKETP